MIDRFMLYTSNFIQTILKRIVILFFEYDTNLSSI